MDASIVIFVLGTLLSVIGWLGQKMFNQIIAEIKSLKIDVKCLREEKAEIKRELESMPCKINHKVCLYPAKSK